MSMPPQQDEDWGEHAGGVPFVHPFERMRGHGSPMEIRPEGSNTLWSHVVPTQDGEGKWLSSRTAAKSSCV
jgi:hypothetical protein